MELLRQVFQKAMAPLLTMINSFIFQGDFDDPYQEFFVEKLYRKSGTKGGMVNSLDYLFKLTSEAESKVPVFLIDTVSTIFKAGSSLHLLRKQGS